MCLTFSYELSNELAFNYVVMTSLVASQSRFLNILHDCRKISCLLSSFMSQKVCSATRARTHTKTDTKVDTGDTLSGFQEFLIQLIIKDQSNKEKTMDKKRSSLGTRTLNLHRGTPWETDGLTTRPFLHLEIVENEYILSKQYYVTW